MSLDLRLPNITAQDEKGQLQQMRSYLYQMVQELNWAMKTVETSAGTAAAAKLAASGTGNSSQNTDPASTFASIKALIIKSADIVEAYYQTINHRLEGLYVAQSDFGVYAEKTSQEIEENSTSIERSFTNIQQVEVNLNTSLNNIDQKHTESAESLQQTQANLQEILTETGGRVESLQEDQEILQTGQAELRSDLDKTNEQMKGIEKILVGVNAYINSGLLYYDDNSIPIYGIEVGQRTQVDGVEVFNKYARFTSNKLSFYDANDNEVAYISDYKLYISNVEITGSYHIGHLLDTVRSDGSVVTTYVGG